MTIDFLTSPMAIIGIPAAIFGALLTIFAKTEQFWRKLATVN